MEERKEAKGSVRPILVLGIRVDDSRCGGRMCNTAQSSWYTRTRLEVSGSLLDEKQPQGVDVTLRWEAFALNEEEVHGGCK